jgi:7-cyano-7-deazaguanine synthase
MNKAILLSGGMDSISLAYWKKPSIAITIDYGHAPAQTEIRSSKIVAETLGIEHHVIRVDCKELGSGDLINEIPLGISPSTEWWPYRNQLLVTLASMKAIKLNISEIMVASVKTDGFHRDGTEKFYEKMNALLEYQEGSIKVTAPCIQMTTVELIRLSGIPKEVLLWAHSCHKSNIACGNCRGCDKYYQVLNELQYV